MRVEFEYSLDDMVDATLRGLAESKVMRSWRWKNALLTSLMTGALMLVLIRNTSTSALVASSVAAVGALVLYPPMYKIGLRRRMRKFCRERHGSEGPFKLEVVLSPTGIATRQAGVSAACEWGLLKKIEETPDSVDFKYRDGGIIVVRKRAFKTENQIREFIDLAESYHRGELAPAGESS